MKKKGLLVIVLLLILYTIAMIIFFRGNDNSFDDVSNDDSINDSNIINDNITKYLIISNVSTWSLKNNKWKKVPSAIIEKNKSHYKIYAGNSYIGEYNLRFANNWNIFNDKDEFIDYDGKLFAFSNNFDIKLLRFNSMELTEEDEDFVNDNYGKKDFNMLYSNEVINIDLDNNGEIDKIICLSNNDEDFDNKDDFYNLVFVKLNDKIYNIIDENKDNSNTLELPIYEIERVFTYESDIYIVIKKIIGIESEGPSYYNYLYKFNGNQFVKIFND